MIFAYEFSCRTIQEGCVSKKSKSLTSTVIGYKTKSNARIPGPPFFDEQNGPTY